MSVAAGLRRVRGTIEGVTTIRLPGGYVKEEYGPLARSPVEWVRITMPTASEQVAGQQQFGVVGAMLEMRYRDDLTEQMRFVADSGEVWDFLGPPVDPDGRRASLEIVVGRAE